ncbi:MAG TPA: carboxypeptidase regulatory-like domain-containing protein, partial [Gemmatimonadaceae bacterium]|nr:carboxypeptidase regulatory-like domain-containing protein [Gemmatimonadaceae bacterium]
EFGWRTLQQTTGVRTGALQEPWTAPSPASLHELGYIVVGTDSTSYRAPGLDMLGSTTFIDDHCFRLVNGDSRATIGVAFEPTSDRRALADIRGTVFVDRATSEVRRMEFHYVYPDVADLADGARGRMEFLRLRNGAWAITQWEIRMPVREIRIAGAEGRVTFVGGANTRVVTTGVRVAGGALAVAVAGADTLWTRPPLALKGVVRDSLTGRGLGGATVRLQGTQSAATTDRDGRFTIDGVLPGEYYLDARTPSLDSLGTSSSVPVSITDGKDPVNVRVPSAAMVVAALCRGTSVRPGTIPGIILGAVAMPDGSPVPAGTRVTVAWTDAATGGARRAELPPDSSGAFRLCNAPVGVAFALAAAADSAASETRTFALTPARPVERAQLMLDRRAVARAAFAGVVTDSARQPLVGAEVFLPDVSLATQTDARGEFALRGIAPGPQRVMVRKVGYGPLDVPLTFRGNETLSRTIVLARATPLGEVRVTAAIADPRMQEFEQHRAAGLGQFLTRDFLRTQEGRPTSQVLAGLRGVRLFQNQANRKNGSQQFIASSRECKAKITYFGRGAQVPTCEPCYALVYLDGMLMTRTEAFDINEISLRDVEAIEYYAGAAEVPSRYLGPDTNCGVVVIHTIRSKADPQP